MRPQPDLAGFAASRGVLRDHFGQEVTFVIPNGAAYAGPTDPQTGAAYDPWEAPVVGGGTHEVVKHVSVVSRPLGGVTDAAVSSPIGRIASDLAAVILPFEEWADVAGATHVVWLSDRYKITEVRDDAMATVYRRKIIYLTKS